MKHNSYISTSLYNFFHISNILAKFFLLIHTPSNQFLVLKVKWELFLLEDKGLRGQRPSKSKTIEEQSRFFMDTSESWAITFYHRDFGELETIEEQSRFFMNTSESWGLRRAGLFVILL
jgi:hypothetical protein